MAEKHSETSCESLIKAAKKVFASLGFEKSTIKDLATEAGLNVSAISYYFGGKEALYEFCLKDFAKSQMGFADRFLKEPQSREDFKLRLRLFCEEFLQLHLREPNLCKILHRDFEAQNPIAMKLFKSSFFPIYKSLENFLGYAKKMKILKPELDPQLASFFIFCMLIHAHKADAMRKDVLGTSITNPKDFDLTIDYLIEISLNGILKDELQGATK